MKEIEFLLVCLADSSDQDSRRLVVQRLLEHLPLGRHPFLYAERMSDPAARLIVRERYLELLNDIKLRHDLKKFLHQRPGPDLELGSFLVSRLGRDRAITLEGFRARLDLLAAPLKEVLEVTPDHQEKVDIFCHYLFQEHRFRGNTENYYDPQNSFLTAILDSKTGIPVTLSVLCLLLARRLGLPLEGVNLPGHFIVKYAADDYLMYIDPFNEGNQLTEQDCLNFLSRQGLEPTGNYLAPATPLVIIKRMYRNLINYHSRNGESSMERKLRQHFTLLESASIRS